MSLDRENMLFTMFCAGITYLVYNLSKRDNEQALYLTYRLCGLYVLYQILTNVAIIGLLEVIIPSIVYLILGLATLLGIAYLVTAYFDFKYGNSNSEAISQEQGNNENIRPEPEP